MGVITDTLNQVDNIVLNFTEAVFTGFAGELVQVASVSSAVLVALIGANMMLQIHPMTVASGVSFLIRLSVVFLLAQSWANFDIIYDLLTDLPQRLGARMLAIGSGGTIGTADGLHGAMDGIVDHINEIATDASSRSSMFGISLVGVLLGLLAALVGVAAVLVISLGKIGLAFMVAIAPLALFASLYRSTKNLFEAWTQTTIGFALIPLVTAGLMSILISVSEQAVSETPRDSIETIGDALGLIVVALASVFMMTRIPDIVRSLSGSIVAVGNGIAEGRDIVRQGVAATGTATRGVALTGRAVGGVARDGTAAAQGFYGATTGPDVNPLRGLSDRLSAARQRILADRAARKPPGRKR